MNDEDDTGEENPAIHGSESGPDAGRGSAGGTDRGSDDVATPESDDVRTTPRLTDQGKDVVDTRGEDLGIVSDVDGETLYVEPDPTLTEKIMSTLHWREGDREEPTVPAERIRRIDDDEVVLDVDGEGGLEP